MKAMLAGFAAIVVISVVAWYGLENAGFSSQEVYSGANVRID
jgi:hypothetical protein